MTFGAKLRDVAEAAGVSINTASRALNNKPDVSKVTREKVLTAAKSLGYVPDGVAQGFRRRRTGTIGVIVADIANPFFSAVVRGIEEVTRSSGYQIILANTDEDLEAEKAAVATLLQKRVDGILLSPCQKCGTAGFDLLLQKRLPFVLMARRFEGLAADFVVNDDAQGGFLATQYLLKKGHRRILFLNGPPEIWSAQQRLLGYQRALEDAGVPVEPQLIVSTTAKMEGAYETIRALLTKGLSFSAVYAFSDLLAMGVIKALKEAKLRVPEDVAVVGHDDIEFAELLETPLTTVDMSKTRLGREAARILIERLRSPENSSIANGVVLQPRLVVRESA